ncbi:hypothetical protein RYX36_016761 [Vicia faba]
MSYRKPRNWARADGKDLYFMWDKNKEYYYLHTDGNGVYEDIIVKLNKKKRTISGVIEHIRSFAFAFVIDIVANVAPPIQPIADIP